MHEWGSADGPPIVFWHGLGPDGDGSAAAPLAAALDPAARLIAPDAPGFGGSPALDPDAYSSSSLSDLTRRLLDALAVDRCAWVGESWGAWVGCHAAASLEGRIGPLVLLDGGYTDPPDWNRVLRRAPSLDRCIALGRARGLANTEAWGAAFWATLQRPYASATYGALWERGIRVLLVAGTAGHDRRGRRARERGLRRFGSALRGADVWILENAGHDVFAAPEVAARVARWLAS